jgi:site-specific DNA-cytosine methylase
VFDSILKFLQISDDEAKNVDWVILENVTALASKSSAGVSNLDVAYHRLQKLGFAVVVFQLDPLMFGQLHSRSRLYIIGVKRRLSSDHAGASEQHIVDIMVSTMKRLVGQPALDLETALLDEDHPLVISRLQHFAKRADRVREGEGCGEKNLEYDLDNGDVDDDVSSKSSAGHIDKKRKKSSITTPAAPAWPHQHAAYFEKHGKSWWKSSQLNELTLQKCPGLFELTARQRDILAFHGLTPDDKNAAIDLNLSIHWSRVTRGYAPCLSSSSLMYIAGRQRCCLGVECLRLMGICFKEEERLYKYDCKFVRDLAGNAFDSASCLASLYVVFVTLAALARNDNLDSLFCE